MISDRYRTVVADLWTDEAKVDVWNKIELANLANLNSELAESARHKIDPSIIRETREIEKTIGHEIEAYVTALNNRFPTGLWHKGLGSSDLVENSTAWSVNRSIDAIRGVYVALNAHLLTHAKLTQEHVCSAYTHGQKAEPITWGYRFWLWANSISLDAMWTMLPGKIGGAAGTGVTVNHLDAVIHNAKNIVGCPTDVDPSQIVPRYHMDAVLCNIGTTIRAINKMANDLRVLFTLGEIQFSKMPVGSSSMPHKVNPYELERVIGLCKIVDSMIDCVNRVNMDGWLERDLIHSSVERECLPVIFNHTFYCIVKLHEMFNRMITNAEDPKTMQVSSIAQADMLTNESNRKEVREKSKSTEPFNWQIRLLNAVKEKMGEP